MREEPMHTKFPFIPYHYHWKMPFSAWKKLFSLVKNIISSIFAKMFGLNLCFWRESAPSP